MKIESLSERLKFGFLKVIIKNLKTMTTKEKAKELVEKFSKYSYSAWGGGEDEMTNEDSAIACAILAVDEMLSVFESAKLFSHTDPHFYDYWRCVKFHLKTWE